MFEEFFRAVALGQGLDRMTQPGIGIGFARKDVAIGIVDVKSYYIETPEDIASRVRYCLKYAPPERLSFAPDCGLSQTARWAAKLKLQNMVKGVKLVRKELGL